MKNTEITANDEKHGFRVFVIFCGFYCFALVLLCLFTAI
jgi:hypothetical protein